MAQKIILISILILVMLGVVYGGSVVQTTLTINAVSGNDIIVHVFNAENDNKVQFFPLKNANVSGILDFKISSFDVKDINIEVSVLKDGVEVSKETFGPYSVKDPVIIDLSSVGSETVLPENETPSENGSTVTFTGSAVEDNKESFISAGTLKLIGIIVAIVFVLGVIMFFIIRNFSGKNVFYGLGNVNSTSPPIVVKKQSEFIKKQKEIEDAMNMDGKHIAQIENRVKELLGEIGKLKNKDKIVEAEKRLEDDRKRLERLRRGEE